MNDPTEQVRVPIEQTRELRFHLGMFGALLPLVCFLAGVTWLGLSGAPDETGFWPVLAIALTAGLLLSRQKARYVETVISGMSQPIVMLMVLAWFLAGVFGTLMAESGMIETLIALARQLGVSGGAYVVATFLICCTVSTATGTSLGTILITGPLLYPVGEAAGASPEFLMGSVIAGATFGDNISPVSDTTIASATTQGADIGGVVRSRLRYAIAAAGVALIGFGVFGGGATANGPSGDPAPQPTGGGVVMLFVPILVIGVLMAKRHLVEGLTYGILVGLIVALATAAVPLSDVLAVDRENFIATGLLLDGMRRGVGVSIFTILLMGLVAGIQGSGVVDRLIRWTAQHGRSQRSVEWWIFGAVTGAVLLTTHAVVAILTVGGLARQVGERAKLSPYRRANLLDMTVCTYPFLLPFFIPTVLAASVTAGSTMPRLSPAEVGLHNIHSWALLAVALIAIATGWGRK